jgi:hypothetical protein
MEPIVIFWQDVIDQIAANLQQMKDSKGNNRYSSGVLAQEIGLENQNVFTEEPNKYVVVITMPSYYKFVDEGVKGWDNQKKNTGNFTFKRDKPPIPLKAIRTFMINRGIVPKDFRKGNIENNLNALAYRIRASIKQKGTEGVPFYSSVVNEKLIESYVKKLVDVYGQDVIDQLTFTINN